MRPRLGRLLVGPIALAAVAMMATPMLAGPASAAPALVAYGPFTCKIVITITPNPAGPGVTITVVISGTCGNDTITIVLHSAPVVLGTLTTDANGNATGTFVIPADTPPGVHTVTATDPSGNTGSVPLTITAASTGTTTTTVAAAAAAATSSGPLAFTGTDAAAAGAVGAGALGVGGLFVLSSRKRRRKAWGSSRS